MRKASLGARVCATRLLSSRRPRNTRRSLSRGLLTRRPSPDALVHPQCSSPHHGAHPPTNTQARKLGATSVHTPHYILQQILVFSPPLTPPLRRGSSPEPQLSAGGPTPCWAPCPLLFLAPALPCPLRSPRTAPPRWSAPVREDISCPRDPQPHPGGAGDTGAGADQ